MEVQSMGAGDPCRPSATAVQLEWAVIAYGLSFAMLLMTAAAVGDRAAGDRVARGSLPA
jgi:hypothetical protein